MAITIGGKVYRNLQEQVYNNLDRIEELEQDVQDLDDTKMTNPMTASGDLIYGGSNGYPNRLPKGSANEVFVTDGVTIGWGKVNKNGISSTGEGSGKVLTSDGSGNASWKAVEGANVKATGVTADKVLTANGYGGAAWLDIVPPEGDQIGSLGESAGKVLTSDGDDGAYWSTMEGNMIGSIGMTAGKVLKANGSGGAAWGDETPEGTGVKSTSETSGKVLTANGSGGSSWQSVPQNFTGSVSGISAVISVGSNQLSSSSGSNGQVMGWSGGPTWGKPGSNFGLGYTTTAPTADNSDGLKIAVLSSDPGTKYNGWLYIITA